MSQRWELVERSDRAGGIGRAGRIVVLLGLAAVATGLFALPLSSYERRYGGRFGFVEIADSAAVIGGRSPIAGRPIFSGLALFWWAAGVWIALGLIVGLLCALIALPAARTPGWALAVVAAAGGIVHGLAMAQSADYRGGVVTLRGYSVSNMYNHAGSGVYVSLCGFAIVLVAGAIVGAGGSRRAHRDPAGCEAVVTEAPPSATRAPA